MLIKYSGKYVKIYFDMKITFSLIFQLFLLHRFVLMMMIIMWDLF